MAFDQFLLNSLPLNPLPKDWEVVHLREVTSKIGSGATPKGGAKVYQDKGVSLIRSQNVYDHNFIKDGLAYIDKNESDKLNNVIVQYGDVLLNITGDSIARCCLVPDWVLPARVNQHVAILRPTERLNSIYLQKCLSLPQFKDYMLSHDAGGTRKALTKGNIENFLIPLPPFEEQKAIARILSSLDDKIELNQQMNRTLEAQAKAIFKSRFMDFDPVRAKMDGRQPVGMDAATAALFPDAFEESPLGMIPKGWRGRTIGDICEFAYGKALKAEDRQPGNVPVYGSNGQIGWHNQALVEGSGIVVGRKGNPGVVTWASKDFYPIDTTFYVIPRSEILSLHYLFYALLNLNLASLSADSAVPGLNRNLAYMTKILISDSALQKVFHERISRFSKLVDVNIEQSRNLSAIRDTLLSKLISGEIRVKEAEKMVREAA